MCYNAEKEREVTTIYVTDHARERIKERVGLPKKAAERNARKALDNGIGQSECTGRLKKYAEHLFLSHRRGGKMRFYGNHIYIFTTMDKLVTVLPLPNEYKPAVNKLLKRRNQHGDQDS